MALRKINLKYLLLMVVLVIISIASIGTVFNRTGRMFEAELNLTEMESRLAVALEEAEAGKAAVAALPEVQRELDAVKKQLTTANDALESTAGELSTATGILSTLETDYDTVSEQLSAMTEQSATLQSKLDNLRVNYDRMTEGYGYVCKDPTYQEMKDFLAADTTDSNEYKVDTYVCVNFSVDVKTNAMKQGIRCAYVVLDFPEMGHAIVAFYTTDRGMVFIEPQSDEEAEPAPGVDYWQCIKTAPERYYTEPDYDDTIQRYTVIW